jgi:phosphotransferase system IIB component
MKNAFAVVGNTAYIELAKPDGTRLLTTVDATLVEHVDAHINTWSPEASNKTYYARAQTRGLYMYLHQWVAGPFPAGMEPDHVDHNGLNNKLININVVTHQQNLQNRRQFRTTTGVKGIHKRKNRTQFQANINNKYIGSFATLEEARRAVELARAA